MSHPYDERPSNVNAYWLSQLSKLGVRLINAFLAVEEYRRNNLLASRNNGIGLGLPYKWKF